MWAHKSSKFSTVVIRAHKELTLIFITAWIAGRGLRSRRQPLKVEFIGVSFPMNFRHYIFVVVISETKQENKSKVFLSVFVQRHFVKHIKASGLFQYVPGPEDSGDCYILRIPLPSSLLISQLYLQSDPEII